MRRHWTPCRVCGVTHKNPFSSGICPDCGIAESAARKLAEHEAQIAFNQSEFGQFMNMPEDERWQWVFDRLKDAGT